MVILSEPRYPSICPAAARTSFVSGLLSSLIAFGLVACGGGSSSLSTARYAVLYSFGSNSSDGATPEAGLIQGSDGNLYGTTSNGGANGGGTVFSVSPSSGTETVLYSFAGDRTDGGDPQAELLQGSDGDLYGTTYTGGAHGDGTIFKVSPTSGAETVLFSFSGGSSELASGLIQGSDGNLYGTTFFGGSNNDGTIFMFLPSSGAETVLYSFTFGSSDGANPTAGVIQGSDGNLYGTTPAGGAYGNGTIFKVSPSSGIETVLYSFEGGSSDGAQPHGGLIQGTDGNLYGVTWEGGTYGNGTVFTFSPIGGVETVLYSFIGGSTDGANPSGRLIQGSDGELYGMTTYGGANDEGTVFELSASGGVETVLHSFAGGTSDGKLPAAGLVQGSDGKLYGTTTYGGANNAGTVFVLSRQ